MFKQKLDKIKSFFTSVFNFFRKPQKHSDNDKSAGNFYKGLGKARKFFQDKIPGKRERIIFVSSIAAAIIVILFSTIIMMNNYRNRSRSLPAAGEISRNVIPPEELFLPEEPDFVPGILLSREQKTSWTAEDAEAYWQDPLIYGEEPWREQIEKTIDEIMERVK